MCIFQWCQLLRTGPDQKALYPVSVLRQCCIDMSLRPISRNHHNQATIFIQFHVQAFCNTWTVRNGVSK